ncbi:DUF342 domain-containing protein [Salsuginibacillus kocurii]|uniref:DUF342 domain-containing protein n=1 Tax=Salsuginibacillus kocurii TaxID=427078 RepID=UPI00036C98AF|nr:FapA family protein [Salsuginibacillus kocurii]
MAVNLDDYFELKITPDKLMAVLSRFKEYEEETEVTLDEVKAFIYKKHKVVYGVNESLLDAIAEDPESLSFPLTIAEGKEPVNGDPAYLKPAQFSEINHAETEGDQHYVDLKQVIDIPMVAQGDFVGEKIPPTQGANGKNVHGEDVSAIPGKDFQLRAGKNTRISEDGLRLYAVVDGQVSIDKKMIHVYPVYEVKGDLDLRVGNIDFVGNVSIKGNVPAGFEVKAKGDIRVSGTVEAAVLEAGGSVYVGAGIVGQGGGLIKAGQDLHATYVNQGNVNIDGDLYVKQALLHSHVEATGSIYCYEGKGNIVGGQASAGALIHAKDVGNNMNTPTSLYLGVNQKLLEQQNDYNTIAQETKQEIEKLETLQRAFAQKEEAGTPLSSKERITKLRIRSSLVLNREKKENAEEELQELNDLFEHQGTGEVKIEGCMYPNTDVNFGKYRRKITTNHQYVRLFVKDSEIKITSL